MNMGPDSDNGILEVYSMETFQKIKTVKFPHHWRFSYFDEDQLMIWQTSQRNFENAHPILQFFDLNKLEVAEKHQIPLQTTRFQYEVFEHFAGCKCEKKKYFPDTFTPCKYVWKDDPFKNQFKSITKLNNEEVIFTLHNPVEKVVPQESIQIWNFKTNKIRNLVYDHEVDKVKDGLIYNKVVLSQHGEQFVHVSNNLVLMTTEPKVTPPPKKEVDITKYTNIVAMVDFSAEQPKTIKMYKCNLNEKYPQKIFYDSINRTLAVATNNSNVCYFDLESGDLKQSINYEVNNNFQIEGVCVSKDEAIMTLGLEKYRKNYSVDPKKKDFMTKVKYFLHIYCNDIHSGKRLGKMGYTIENCMYSENPVEILGSFLRTDKDAVVVSVHQSTLYREKIKGKQHSSTNKNFLLLFEVPEKNKNQNYPIGEIKSFDEWRDASGKHWNDKHICMCGKFLNQTYGQAKQYIPNKGYCLKKHPFCHTCTNQYIHWFCPDCQQGICTNCREQVLKPKKQKCKSSHEMISSYYPAGYTCSSCQRTPPPNSYGFACESCKIVECLKCNEAREWHTCRDSHEFEVINQNKEKSVSCRRCGTKDEQKLFKCTENLYIFCKHCLVEDRNIQKFDLRTLQPICALNHCMKTSRVVDRCANCIYCERNSQTNSVFKFYCSICDYSYCFEHSTLYEDIMYCENGHNLEKKKLSTLRVLCTGCQKQISHETLQCTSEKCQSKYYCFECLPAQKRTIAQKLYQEQVDIAPLCSNKHYMVLQNLKTIGDRLCISCKQKQNQKFNLAFFCESCQEMGCFQCFTLSQKNLLCTRGHPLSIDSVIHDTKCIGCQEMQYDMVYMCHNRNQMCFTAYCFSCVPKSIPIPISRARQTELQELYQKLYDQYKDQKEEVKEKRIAIEYMKCQKDPSHIMKVEFMTNSFSCSLCRKSYTFKVRWICSKFLCGFNICTSCVVGYDYSIRCENEHDMMPDIGNFSCLCCKEQFIKQKSTFCDKCDQHFCQNCLPTQERTEEDITRILQTVKQPEKQSDEDMPRCKKGHIFEKLKKDWQWECDNCHISGTNIKGEWRWHCGACNFDSCDLCIEKHYTKEQLEKQRKIKQKLEEEEKQQKLKAQQEEQQKILERFYGKSKAPETKSEQQQQPTQMTTSNPQQPQPSSAVLQQPISNQTQPTAINQPKPHMNFNLRLCLLQQHNPYLTCFDEAYHQYKLCAVCNKQSTDKISNGSWKMYYCKQCQQYFCMSCHGYPFAEMMACSEGHKLSFLDEPISGTCSFCNKTDKFIQWECADSKCYRYKICSQCVKPISASTVDAKMLYEPMQKAAKSAQKQYELRKCKQKQHTTILTIINQVYYDQTKCAICTRKCVEKNHKGQWLMYRCKQCDQYYCLDCRGYPFQELIACSEGHQMKFLEEPMKNTCSFCGDCENSIQWECEQPNCYRYKLCNKCIKPISAQCVSEETLYKEMMPVQSGSSASYNLRMCKSKQHATFVESYSQIYYDQKTCVICHKKSQEKNAKGDWLMHKCKQCAEYYCYSCHGYPFSEIVACSQGHQMKFQLDPNKNQCSLCGNEGNIIQWECEDKGCYRYKICNQCIRPMSATSVDQSLVYQEMKEKVEKNTYELRKCLPGLHATYVDSFSSAYYDGKKCAICKQKSQEKNSKGDWMMHYCSSCSQYYCYECYGYPFQELVACSKGHQMKFHSEPVQNQCSFCGNSGSIIHWECEAKECYRYKICKDCIKPVTCASLDRNLIYAMKQPAKEKDNNFKLRLCRSGQHVTSIQTVSNVYLDSCKCANCNQKGQEKTTKGDWLMHYCKNCKEYYCLQCYGYPFQELLACAEGHHMKYIQTPIKSWCKFCDKCEEKIQWECTESQCYRYKICSDCIKPISAENLDQKLVYRTMVPPEKKQNKYKPRTCKSGQHNTYLTSFGSAYYDCKKCTVCQNKSQQKNQKGDWMMHHCKQCDQYYCYDCYGYPFQELVTCDQGHQMQFLEEPIQAGCKFCDKIEKSIQWECTEKNCYRYKICNNCIKPMSADIIDMQLVYAIKEAPQPKINEFKLRMCKKGEHVTYVDTFSNTYRDQKKCANCNQVSQEKTSKGDWLLHVCTKCSEYYCFQCYGYPFQEMVACKEGHHMTFVEKPIKNWCKFCDKCEEKIQWECPDKNCYRYKICSDCLKPITASSLDKELVYKPMVQIPAKQQAVFKLRMCRSGQHTTYLHNYSNSYYDQIRCKLCGNKSTEKTLKGNWLIHKCIQCDECYCFSCHGYPFQELVACKDGHKLKFLDQPIKNWCQFCEKCENKIQWECAEKNCYRYKVCTDCLKPVSATQINPDQIYQPMKPVLWQKYQLRLCLSNQHPVYVRALTASQKDSCKCKKCGSVSAVQNKKGQFMIYFCKACDQYVCYNCFGLPNQEIMACDKGHHMIYFADPIRKFCKICDQCDTNIFWECIDASCGTYKVCSNCVKPKSVVEKQ